MYVCILYTYVAWFCIVAVVIVYNTNTTKNIKCFMIFYAVMHDNTSMHIEHAQCTIIINHELLNKLNFIYILSIPKECPHCCCSCG